MHGIVKFLILLLRSLFSVMLLYSIVILNECNTMPCINLSEYWTTSRGEGVPRGGGGRWGGGTPGGGGGGGEGFAGVPH